MTLYDILEKHAHSNPHATAFVFIDSSGEQSELSNLQLLNRAQALAAELLTKNHPGDRVLLMFQPGLDFISAILACFASGVIAVPVQPLQNKRVLSRLRGVIENSGARVMLTNSFTQEALLRTFPDIVESSGVQWLCSDQVSDAKAKDFHRPSIDSEATAFLQYTSGSTGTPKGVMVSHHNLLDNSEAIKQAFGHDEKTVVGGWLPLYHDMGLIGNVFQPLYLGVPSILLSPMSFLMSPVIWLRTISKWKITSSGGPSFAYDLCVKQVSDADFADLDLSSWKVAFNGAEPVRAQVLKSFTEKFSAAGFRPEAFYPCYGMAEVTLFLSGGDPNKSPCVLSVDPDQLSAHVVRETSEGVRLVSCGRSFGENQFRIVDPEFCKELSPDQVGEVWAKGPSVARGYWGREDLTVDVFRAYLDTGEGPFLRTGDLGFIHDGELFINGRIKDLIIVRGQNHYPDDIELTAYESHELLRTHGSAAFTVVEGEEQKLILVCEVERAAISKMSETLYKEILSSVRKSVSEKHGLRVSELQLIRPASLPKTSSGKVQRRRCHDLYLNNELAKVHL